MCPPKNAQNILSRVDWDSLDMQAREKLLTQCLMMNGPKDSIQKWSHVLSKLRCKVRFSQLLKFFPFLVILRICLLEFLLLPPSFSISCSSLISNCSVCVVHITKKSKISFLYLKQLEMKENHSFLLYYGSISSSSPICRLNAWILSDDH